PRRGPLPVAPPPRVAAVAPSPADEDDDGFEDVKTEALLLMASELMTQSRTQPRASPHHEELESLLAGIDDE
ncbi:MAG: hypothetical protein ACO3JL_19195, partial [Myxococcota bacterium]